MTIQIFGILNLTPDSFSDGQSQATPLDFLEKAKKLIHDGANVLDIGAESTRPDSSAISAEEEWARLHEFLILFRKEFPHFPLSLDTKKYDVALKAVPFGIDYINDVSFLSDPRLAHLAEESGAKYILMHTRGNHALMQSQSDYGNDFFVTLKSEIELKLLKLKQQNFPFAQLILDPGFGFAKTQNQCVLMMQRLEFWQHFDLPLMLGISRKRFLQQYVGESFPQDRDEISAEKARDAVEYGFYNLRVHNVALTKKFLTQGSKKV